MQVNRKYLRTHFKAKLRVRVWKKQIRWIRIIYECSHCIVLHGYSSLRFFGRFSISNDVFIIILKLISLINILIKLLCVLKLNIDVSLFLFQSIILQYFENRS